MNNSLKNIDASKSINFDEKYPLTNGFSFDISNETVTPKVGNQTTLFNFSITFINQKNIPPKSINVVINETKYSLEKLNLSDNNYTDGCIYETQINLDPSQNNYSFYFECSNGTHFKTTIIYNNLRVNNVIIWSSVRLDNIQIGTVITHGEENPRTTYFRLVEDLENKGAIITDITSIIDSNLLSNYDILWFMAGGSSMATSEIDAIEQWVYDGGRFLISHTLSGAPSGLAQKFNISSVLFSGIIYPPSTIYSHPITQSVKNVEVYSINYYLDLSLQPKANVCVRFGGYDSIMAMEHGNGSFVIMLNNLPLRITREDNRLLCHNTFGWLSHKKNDFEPILDEEKVSPLTGNQLTVFNFSVNYIDHDNNPPEFINVVINGTNFVMKKVNPMDINYTDGCYYQNVTYLSPANYNYSYLFKCADREFYTSTISKHNLYVEKINNFIPSLTNGDVNFKRGPQGSILYKFSVNYTDSENNPPTYVNLTINSQTISMDKQDPLDNNYTDGVIYTYTAPLNSGIYSYYFNCSDGLYYNSNGPYHNLFVRNWSQIQLGNLNIGAIISHGEQNPRTKYPILVSDLYSRGTIVSDITDELDLNVLLDYNLIWFDEGGVSMNTNELEAIEQWVQQGGQIITTGDGIGTINSLAQIFNISIIDVSYRSGFTNDIFAHPITQNVRWLNFIGVGEYIDISSQPLANPCVKLEGLDQIITMAYGKGYVIMILEDFGWQLAAQDNFLFIKNTFGWFSRMKNDYSPILIEESVSPLSGNQVTLFNFSIVYFDQDNNHPESINVHINETIYAMEKINPLDLNYLDGCGYQLLTYISPSTYNYIFFFSCADRDFNYSTIMYYDLKIDKTNNFNPQLINPNVNPEKGTNIDLYEFTVWYYDNDNDLPLNINITINQTTYSMDRVDPTDNWALDGIKYFYITTLSPGFYKFQINCFDGVFANSTNWIDSPEVEWDLTGSPIYINGNGDWASKAAAYGWCCGNGTINDPYVIDNILIDGKSSYCIVIENSNVYFIIKHCTIFNSGNFYSGIELVNVKNGLIVNNICYNNFVGIALYSDSGNNTILRNTVYSNDFTGIYIGSSNNNSVLYNYVYNNGELGIHLGSSDYTIVKYNTATQNQETGISLYVSNFNKVFRNYVLQNKIDGFNIEYSGSNLIFDNTVKDNKNYGIYLSGGTSKDNLFFNNSLINNNINAYNLGGTNYWNNSVIGNYWDDYNGVDLNDDYIGDTPHNFGTGVDYLPIWDDGDDDPIIVIDKPDVNDIFGYKPPRFQIMIIGEDLHTSWYTLNDDLTKYIIIENEGYISQVAWNLCENGTVKIKFYANDTSGNNGYKEVIVHKDIKGPEIYIYLPEPNEFYGTNAPLLDLYINDGNLLSIWYTIDDGIKNFTLNELSGIIDQTEWDKISDGSIILRIYAIDTQDNIGYTQVTIYKDTIAPTTTLLLTPYNRNNIVNKSTTFTLSADDGIGSGILIIRYKINDSDWIDYTGTFDLSNYEYGYYLISYQAIDTVGNVEEIKEVLVKLVPLPIKPSKLIINSYNFDVIIVIICIAILFLIKKKLKIINI